MKINNNNNNNNNNNRRGREGRNVSVAIEKEKRMEKRLRKGKKEWVQNTLHVQLSKFHHCLTFSVGLYSAGGGNDGVQDERVLLSCDVRQIKGSLPT